MDCPNCRLVNPASALRCDCGYDFKSRRLERSHFGGQGQEGTTAATSGSERLLIRFLLALVVVVPGIWKLSSTPRDSATGQILRQWAYDRFSTTKKKDRITDPAIAFVDKFHDSCLEESDAGSKEAAFGAVRDQYKDCMEKAFRERP